MTDKEKLIKIKSLADAMYYAAFNMTTDASLLRKAMKEYHQFIIHEYHKEEPVSKALEEAGKQYLERSNPDRVHQITNAFKAGAEWKKNQLMAKAVDGVITFDYYGNDNKTYGCIAHDSFCLEDIGLKDTDNVKMIIVKDEMP